MLDRIRRFLTETSGQSDDKGKLGEDELQLAAAALLFHVIAVDGAVSDAECAMLTDLLSRRFELDPVEAKSLVKAAKAADAEAIDLYGFTSVLKRRLDAADRARIIEMMWKLVYADGTVHEFEDNAVWRVAELLGVSSQDRIRLKKAVSDNAG
jgi:uncharacterized tellurite resistance protein B-like protein